MRKDGGGRASSFRIVTVALPSTRALPDADERRTRNVSLPSNWCRPLRRPRWSCSSRPRRRRACRWSPRSLRRPSPFHPACGVATVTVPVAGALNVTVTGTTTAPELPSVTEASAIDRPSSLKIVPVPVARRMPVPAEAPLRFRVSVSLSSGEGSR